MVPDKPTNFCVSRPFPVKSPINHCRWRDTQFGCCLRCSEKMVCAHLRTSLIWPGRTRAKAQTVMIWTLKACKNIQYRRNAMSSEYLGSIREVSIFSHYLTVSKKITNDFNEILDAVTLDAWNISRWGGVRHRSSAIFRSTTSILARLSFSSFFFSQSRYHRSHSAMSFGSGGMPGRPMLF